MNHYTGYITDRRGVIHRYALIAMDREDAMREAALLAAAVFRHSYTYSVRAQ